jgi:peptidoglycan/LPS O-acetylase OafA/YrhL
VLDGGLDHEPLWASSDGQISLGTCAVLGFFIVSGFLVSQSWENSAHVGEYLWKRILRIYPAFIVAFLLCLFLFAPLGAPESSHRFGAWGTFLKPFPWRISLAQLFTLNEPRMFSTLATVPIPNRINASMWTIKYEFLCYLLLPLLAMAGIYRRRTWMLLVFVGLALFQFIQTVCNYYPGHHLKWRYLDLLHEFPRMLTYFLAGAVFYLFRDRIPRSRVLLLLAIAVSLASLHPFRGVALTLPFTGPYILFYLAFTPLSAARQFGRYGDFSYGLYLYAWPMQQLLVLFCGVALGVLPLTLLTMVIALLFAFVSWHLIEKPALRWKKRLPGWLNHWRERPGPGELPQSAVPVKPAKPPVLP